MRMSPPLLPGIVTGRLFLGNGVKRYRWLRRAPGRAGASALRIAWLFWAGGAPRPLVLLPQLAGRQLAGAKGRSKLAAGRFARGGFKTTTLGVAAGFSE